MVSMNFESSAIAIGSSSSGTNGKGGAAAASASIPPRAWLRDRLEPRGRRTIRRLNRRNAVAFDVEHAIVDDVEVVIHRDDASGERQPIGRGRHALNLGASRLWER